MDIRTLNTNDCVALARIHLSELPDDFCSLLGLEFLQDIFYPALLAACEVKLGVINDKNTVVGFIFFTSDTAFFRTLVMKYGFGMVRLLSLSTLISPRFWKYVAEVFLLLLMRDKRLPIVEEVYLAVAKEYQGQWLAFQLFSKGFEELRQRGFSQCWLKTLKSTPENIALYQRVGFRELRVFLGRVYMVADCARN